MRFHFGMEPVEVVGANNDHDGDGVANEITIGEMSALAIFNTNQPPPCEVASTRLGAWVFRSIGCAECHIPAIDTRRKVLPYQFPEVGSRPFDKVATYFTSDLSQPPAGFPPASTGNGISVRAFTDLKRHDMGSELEETLHSASTAENRHFITARLWGVADTAPYMHDGRATTLTEAIRLHGEEGAQASLNFFGTSIHQRKALLSYLRGLRTPGSSTCN